MSAEVWNWKEIVCYGYLAHTCCYQQFLTKLIKNVGEFGLITLVNFLYFVDNTIVHVNFIEMIKFSIGFGLTIYS